MKVEPPADLRQMADAQFQMYQAWMDAGFSDNQALVLLRAVVRAWAQR